MRPQPPCPECEKLAAVSEESNKIGDFIDWLNEIDIVLCKFDEDSERFYSIHQMHSQGINTLLAQYYGIDLDKVERERRALLDWIREAQGVSE
jgi:hypothetical protein